MVTLVQIDSADYVACLRRHTGGDAGRRVLSVDGRLVRGSRNLHVFVAGFAPQSVVHTRGVSGCRNDVNRVYAVIDFFDHFLLCRWKVAFRERNGSRDVALAGRPGLHLTHYFADGCFQ